MVDGPLGNKGLSDSPHGGTVFTQRFHRLRHFWVVSFWNAAQRAGVTGAIPRLS
ncbi:hypothetical protein ACVWXB_005721 [Streptomyces sp. TE12347]